MLNRKRKKLHGTCFDQFQAEIGIGIVPFLIWIQFGLSHIN